MTVQHDIAMNLIVFYTLYVYLHILIYRKTISTAAQKTANNNIKGQNYALRYRCNPSRSTC